MVVVVCIQRKAFYSDQRTQLKKKIEQDSVRWPLYPPLLCGLAVSLSVLSPLWCGILQCFNEEHAANLLLGDGKEVMRLFREKFNKKLVNLKYKPFMLFRYVWIGDSVLGGKSKCRNCVL